MTTLNVKNVSKAIEDGGSVRAAAKLLGKSYTALQWWIARNGYEVKRECKAVLMKRSDNETVDLTAKGQAAIEDESEETNA